MVLAGLDFQMVTVPVSFAGGNDRRLPNICQSRQMQHILHASNEVYTLTLLQLCMLDWAPEQNNHAPVDL